MQKITYYFKYNQNYIYKDGIEIMKNIKLSFNEKQIRIF